jgi:hypothetical protein
MLRARKNAITTRHQPRADTSGVDALTSSELLKIETALAQKPSANAPADALALVFYAMVEVNGIEPMTSCLQSRRSPN